MPTWRRKPSGPHAERLKPAQCATCHEAAVAAYDTGVHAQARRPAATWRRRPARTATACTTSCRRRTRTRAPTTAAPRHVRQVPRERGDHQAGQDRHRQRLRSVPGQHSRPGADQERPDRRAQLHRLSQLPRHPPKNDPESRVFRRRSRHLRQVPRRHRPRVQRRHPREAAAKGSPLAPVCSAATPLTRSGGRKWRAGSSRSSGNAARATPSRSRPTATRSTAR